MGKLPIICAFSLSVALAALAASASGVVRDGSARPASVRIVKADATVPSAVYDEIGLPVAEGGEVRNGDLVPLTIAHPLARPLIEKGLVNLHNVPADRDAWEVVEDGGKTYLLGSNPRAVMQAAWAYVDDPGGALPRSGEFAFRYRIFAGKYNGAINCGKATRPGLIRYLSYIGASHVAPVNDFAGNANKNFFNYVDSETFPNAAQYAPGTPKDRANRRKALRAVIDEAKRYGLGILFETILMPALSGKDAKAYMDEHFSPDVVSWMNPYQNWGLCVNHPKVREFYREVTAKFFREFPEIDLVHYITKDAGGDLCDPTRCPQCKGRSNAQIHDDISMLVYSAITNVSPNVKLVTSGFDWDRRSAMGDAYADRMAQLPPGVGFSAAAVTDSVTSDRQLHSRLRRARDVTMRSGQVFIGRDSFFRFDDVLTPKDDTLTDDYPLGVEEKIVRWENLEADGFYDVRGRRAPEYPSLNGLFVRKALQEPVTPVFARSVASALFGDSAADAVVGAWLDQRRAQRILSVAFAFPSASRVSQYFPWFIGRHSVPVPSAEAAAIAQVPFGRTNKGEPIRPIDFKGADRMELPPAHANGWTYFDGTYAERLENAGNSMIEASKVYDDALSKLKSVKTEKCATPQFMKSLMGASFEWDAADYLLRHSASVEQLAILNHLAGLYIMLSGVYLRLDCDDAKYMDFARPRLGEYLALLRRFDVFLADAEAKGLLKRTGSMTKEVLGERIRLLEDLTVLQPKGKSQADASGDGASF